MGTADHMYAGEAVQPKARHSVHKAILDWFAGQPRGRVLDAPAGYGHLSRKLADLGFAVTCGEIAPEIFQAPGLECVRTDLNRDIDAPDAAFDYVCCVDGLEHMTDPYRAVAEFARVLRPGGLAVFSLPNYANLEKRLKFVWYGYLTKPVDPAAFAASGRQFFDLHNSPLTITLLEFMLTANGLELLELRRNAVKRGQLLLLPLAWLMWAADRLLSTVPRRQRHRTDLTLHPAVLLGGNNLIVIARKRTGP
jgi:SAM-dependent methyltransferase